MKDLIAKFLDDPYFIKLIFDPEVSVERYWEDYMEEHKSEKPTILKIKQELTLLKLKNKKLTEKEKTKLFNKIVSERKKNLE